MTFTPNIPVTGQTLGATKTLVNGNFTNYSNLVSQDHIGPNLTGQGKHNKSTYVAQGSDPTTAANEDALYTKSVGGIIELFLARASAGQIIQMTAGSTVAGGFGQSFLPGGIQIKWGAKPAGATGSTITVNFVAQGLTNFSNNFFMGLAIANANGRIMNISSGSTTQIVVAANSSLGVADNFYWLAIGN